MISYSTSYQMQKLQKFFVDRNTGVTDSQQLLGAIFSRWIVYQFRRTFPRLPVVKTNVIIVIYTLSKLYIQHLTVFFILIFRFISKNKQISIYLLFDLYCQVLVSISPVPLQFICVNFCPSLFTCFHQLPIVIELVKKIS